MYPVYDQLNALNKANIDVAFRLATLALEGTECLLKLQTNALRSAFDENARNLRAVLEGRDYSEVAPEWSAFYNANPESILDAMRNCVEAASQTQSDLYQLWNGQLATFTKSLAQNLEEFTKATSGGGQTAAAMLGSIAEKARRSGDRPGTAKKTKEAA